MSAINTQVPRVLLMDGAALLKIKTAIADNDPAFALAGERLRQDADAALSTRPVSVMDKSFLPPSGDKHDYMSFGPYWWPNPATPDSLPYIRRDGEKNPEGDALDRKPMEQMASAVRTLAPAYFFTGHAPYAEHAARLLRVWFIDEATRMNPHLEYGQSIPGICAGRGIGIIDTRGLAELTDCVRLLEGSPAWTDTDSTGMREWLARYLAWLLESEHGRAEAVEHNNHGTWFDVQAAGLALFLGEEETAARILRAVPERRITAHITPDGRQPHELARTRAFSYSAMNLAGLFDLAVLGERVGVDLWRVGEEGDHPALLRRALDFLVPYAVGDAAWTYPQITDFDTASALLPLLLRAARAYPGAGYEAVIRRLHSAELAAHRANLLYPM